MPSVDDGESNVPRVAASVHLVGQVKNLSYKIVGQVLDEAYVIAVAAHESGRRPKAKIILSRSIALD